ncbi:MAG TPA: bifunctional phosphoribosyl-AMP cyclohydrolase/phosphoribosyl-ATP diphosphatase HisIE [Allosphingosinicella sp.]|nr:bifunctional phosphoribosyl-AMP cyclohydrolase/phosphoribosyl-ATP diphosphatase HisIE [Allosphingosinicella sp.]
MTADDIPSLDWEKMAGLIPAIVQDAATGEVLMLGYMSPEALQATLDRKMVVFFSRSKGRLWQKGETSGNVLRVNQVVADCDGDTLLIKAVPQGHTCHLGTDSCFGDEGALGIGFLPALSRIVADRARAGAAESYTARLIGEGVARIAQKVGEEGVELALAAVSRDREACIEETADLLYHLAVLMQVRGFDWNAVGAVLRRRHAD